MISDTKLLPLSDGINLHLQIHESGHPVWLIATHGVGEHLGRHRYLYDLFASHFNICWYDLRGHGKSEGKKAYIEEFTRFFVDLDEIINFLIKSFRMKRYILFGHSMGALITAGYLQNYIRSNLYPERVFLNAPPAGIPGFLGHLMEVLPLSVLESMGNIPSFQLKGLVDLKYLSHDPRIKEAYLKDNLVCKSPHIGLLLKMILMSRKVFSKEIEPRCPAYCTVGSEDKIISVSALRNYFEVIEKKFKYFEIEGGYHELHFDVEKYSAPYFSYLKDCIMESL
jgi:acylglycerol lipase